MHSLGTMGWSWEKEKYAPFGLASRVKSAADEHCTAPPVLATCPIRQNHGGQTLLELSRSREKRVSWGIFFVGAHTMPFISPTIKALLHPIWIPFRAKLQRQTRPVTGKPGTGALMGLPRARKDLLLENAFLRHQLMILARQNFRPKITVKDRLRLLFLARLLPNWKSLLRIIQPETLLRWHRELFKHFSKKKSGTQHHPKRISEETMARIRKMAEENRLWGAERIRGELLKLEIKIAKRTIQKYLPKDRHPSGQAWPTFLKNHAQEIFVCDFTVVHDFCFRPIYLLVVMHLATRQIKHFNLTRNPSDTWMAQQMREISAWGDGP
jgi:hypothetical protein